MEKRTWHYIQSPKVHEIAFCSCGNEDTQWSEYEKHLWCDKCQKDFIPTSNGIFDGPIAIQTARMLGLSFDRYNLQTNQVEVIDDIELQHTGVMNYIVCHNTKEVFSKKKFPIVIKQYVSALSKVTFRKGMMSFSNGKIDIKLLDDLHELEIKHAHDNNHFATTFKFEYPNTQTFHLGLRLSDDSKSFGIKKTKEFADFKQFVLKNELDNDLLLNNTTSKLNKI